MKHRLTNINTEDRSATCSVCGDTTIIGKGAGLWACATVRRKGAKGRHGVRRDKLAELRDGASCAICGSTENLALDHDHNDGTLRGFLCRACNTGIGLLREDVEVLAKAIEYLNDPPGVS